MGFNKKWNATPEKVLETRLASLIELSNNTKEYPIKVRMLGFPLLIVQNREEIMARIKELSEILNVNVTTETTIQSEGTSAIVTKEDVI